MAAGGLDIRPACDDELDRAGRGPDPIPRMLDDRRPPEAIEKQHRRSESEGESESEDSFLEWQWEGEQDTWGDFIEDVLEPIDFVEWDRFIEQAGIEGRDARVTVYGWVPRDGDGYKDFVVWEFWSDGSHRFITSNGDVEREIVHRHPVFDEPGGGCKRVENYFDLDSAIELDQGGEAGE